MPPVLILRRELNLGDMAQNRGHRHLAVAPARAKIVVKDIVLDILVPRVVLLGLFARRPEESTERGLTTCEVPPER